jgi:hypothetical protein
LTSYLFSKNLKIKIYKKNIILPVVFYVCGTWSFTLSGDHRLRVYENRVLRKIFKYVRGEVAGRWRRMHNEELHNLYISQNIIRIIISKQMRWAGHVAHNEQKHSSENLKGRYHAEYPDVDGKIILEWILGK